MVKVFRDPSKPPIVGRVVDLTPKGIVVKPQRGPAFVAQHNEIEAEKAVARLDVPKPKPARAGPNFTGMRPATPEDRARLKVPPAWTNVHVSLDPNARLQARGLDAKGRTQSRYSTGHHSSQADKKFARMKAFHEKLPQLDAALQRDARTNDTAAAVYLMRVMGVRNGSEKDTKAKKFAYGASNLRVKHVLFNGDNVTLSFDAKDNVHLTLPVTDPKLKELLRAYVAGKGPEDRLFRTNEGKTNAYVKQQTGADFMVKDLRTYLANELALTIMASMPRPTTLAQFRRQRLEVARRVSVVLGNTPQIVLKSYLDPAIFDTWTQDASWSV